MRRCHRRGSTPSATRWKAGCARRASIRRPAWGIERGRVLLTPPPSAPRGMTTRRWLGAAAVVAALLLVARVFAGTYVEYRWFAALGAASVWRARFFDLLLLRAVGTLLAGAFTFANLAGVSSSVASLILPRRLGNLEIGEEVPGQRLLGAAAIIAGAIGLMLSLLLDDWTTVDLLRRGLPFGEEEVYTGHDLAFFVYWLPLENALYVWALVTLVTVTALVVFLYALTPSL